MRAQESATDADIGLDGFFTPTPGIGGRLKVRVDDFHVDEVGGLPPEAAQGRYTCALIRLENWETNRFVGEASRRLQMSRKKIHFSGTKDKRGVTRRAFTFDAPPEAVQGLGALSGVTVERVFRTNHESQLGDHISNQFRIVCRDVEGPPETLRNRLETIQAQLHELGGAPNAFGPQRFGASRATTHLVGRLILQGRFADAAYEYVRFPSPDVVAADRDAWGHAWTARDPGALLALTRDGQGFERAILHRLRETPDDPIRALEALPKNLQLLFVFAAQSIVFNRLLCARRDAGLPLGRAVEGDLVAPIEDGQLQDEWIPVRAGNLERVNLEIKAGRAAPTGILPGFDVPMAEGRPGQLEAQVAADSGLTRHEYVVPEKPEWSSRGTRRALVVRPEGLRTHVGPDELHPGRSRVDFEFALPRGAYATSLLREFLKSARLVDYA